ncbi:MAG: hypothetical protein LUH07_07740, partial [Lachnospiraceae bacterium]|nr:hypothetical protein [Lachnospiraceae bacterium]
DKGAVARRAVNLEQKGYLTRKENPADGRSQLVYPSEKADSLKNSGNAAEELFYEWLLEAFSEKERESFCEMLDILCQKAEQESRDGYPNVCERMQHPALGRESCVMQNRHTTMTRPASGIKSDAGQEEGSSDSEREVPAREKRREPDVWLL